MQQLNKQDLKSICFVIPKYAAYYIGGAELQVYFLIKEFLNRGWKVEVVCRMPEHGTKVLQKDFDDSRVQLHFYHKHSFRSLEFLSVLKALRRTKAQYYYQRTDFSLTGATANFCKRFNRKMIYACAQQGDATKGKYIAEFRQMNYNNVLKKALRYLDFCLLDKIVEYGKTNAHAIVCQTQEQVEAFTSVFKRNVHLINNSFLFEEDSTDRKENIVLWVGNWRPVKRPELLLELAKDLANKKDWTFVMIGETDEATLKLFENNIALSNIKIVGSLPLKEVNQWYSKSRILVNTSIQEGMPNTFIQAWHYRLHVISLAVNPADLLQNNDFGICCDGSYNSLKSAVLKSIEESKTPGEHAHQYVDNNFNIKSNVDRLINIFNEIR